MRRRNFLALVSAAAVSGPRLVRAQQVTGKTRVVGVLTGASEDSRLVQTNLAEFRTALKGLGWSEGNNLRFEVRWARGEPDRLRAAVTDLVKLAPDVILCHGTNAIAALKPATRSIPVVFVIVNDPVAQGFVPSIAHPGGNITGFSFIDYSMIGKALGLLKQMAPGVTRIGFMFDPGGYPYYEVYLHTLQEQRQALGLDIEAIRLSAGSEIESAVSEFAAKRNGGIIAPPSAFSLLHSRTIIEQATQHQVPLILPFRDGVQEGGLMSYVPDQSEIFRRAAPYIDRILKGANPGDLPVQAPIKFEFVINLKTAKTLGLSIPPEVLAIADEVIE